MNIDTARTPGHDVPAAEGGDAWVPLPDDPPPLDWDLESLFDAPPADPAAPAPTPPPHG